MEGYRHLFEVKYSCELGKPTTLINQTKRGYKMSDITYKLEREIDWFISEVLTGLLNGITKEEEGEALKYVKDYYPIGINLVGVVRDWIDNTVENREDEYEYEDEWNYKNGKDDGIFTKWYENGEKEFEGNYKNGKEYGIFTVWYENGEKKSERNWKDGKLDGIWTGWFNNGEKKFEYNYKNGEYCGLFTVWYENGEKEWEGNWLDGKFVRTIII